jgi:hypothetical protein
MGKITYSDRSYPISIVTDDYFTFSISYNNDGAIICDSLEGYRAMVDFLTRPLRSVEFDTQLWTWDDNAPEEPKWPD